MKGKTKAAFMAFVLLLPLWILCVPVPGAVASINVRVVAGEEESLVDPALETRARDLFRELRCPVCQSQSVDDSDAPLAKDLRALVRARLLAGDSDEEVLGFLTARYGEFVRLRPRLRAHTLALWATPVLALLTGIFLARLLFRRRRVSGDAGEGEPESGRPLTQEERHALGRITGDQQDNG